MKQYVTRPITSIREVKRIIKEQMNVQLTKNQSYAITDRLTGAGSTFFKKVDPSAFWLEVLPEILKYE